MKKTLLILLVILGATSVLKAQSTVPTKEQKQLINPLIDGAFERWAYSWRTDKYEGRSAKIEYIDEDENYGDITVLGSFTYRRFYQSFNGTFSANIGKDSENNIKVMKIRYTDSNGVTGSKSF